MTGGKVAYIYMPDTSLGGLTAFNRYFYAQIGKEAAIVDERFNGGGLLDYVGMTGQDSSTYISTINLNSANGTQTVYAKFKDSANNWSNAVNGSIFLDSVAPSGGLSITSSRDEVRPRSERR